MSFLEGRSIAELWNPNCQWAESEKGGHGIRSYFYDEFLVAVLTPGRVDGLSRCQGERSRPTPKPGR